MNSQPSPVANVEQESASAIVRFVNVSLEQKDRSGICAILAEIAAEAKATAVILWEADPDILINNPEARLFTAGHWIIPGKPPLVAHRLSLARSLAGLAIQSNEVLTSNEIWSDERIAKPPFAVQFYKDQKVGRCQMMPIQFLDGRVGALALYRTADDPAFSEGGEPILLQFCRLLPKLQDSLHHKVSFSLIDRIRDILQAAEDHSKEPARVWHSVCKAIQEGFHLLESTIFLEDPIRNPGEFRLEATTCKQYVSKEAYQAGDEGLTNWVINNRKPIRMWDLRYCQHPKEKLLMEKLYSGLVRLDRPGDAEATAELLNIPKDKIPPLSFIAEPILSGDKICGVLRCCTATQAPFYFTHRERAMFAVIASLLGQYRTKWLQRRTIHEENSAWSNLVQSITALNHSVNSELKKQSPDVLNVFRKALAATEHMIPGGEVTAIRLRNKDTGKLYFALTQGPMWTDEKRRLSFDVDKKPPQSDGARVFQTGQIMVIPDVQAHPSNAIFPDTKSMLIAPIRSANTSYGVIDIRSTGRGQFPEYAEKMAELLGQQLGLYYALIETFGIWRKIEQQLQDQTRITNAAFADWQHQIRGPLNQAYLRLRDVFNFDFADYDSAPHFLKVQRGLMRKAKRASQSLQLFLSLSKAERLKLNLERVQSSLTKLLVETCLDNRILALGRRKVGFIVKTDSFRILDDRPLLADADLLEQAVNNIIDNAFKYSFHGTTIEISGTSLGSFFCLAVSNEGVTLSAEDAAQVAIRGWRAEKAISVVGEGSGIGLWVVDHIMIGHGGRLEVLPTSGDRTEVRLLFPWR